MSLIIIVILVAVCCGCAHSNFQDFVSNYETLRITPTITERDAGLINAHVSFTAHKRDFRLILKTNRNLFAPDFHMRIHEDNGRILTHSVDTRHYVTGHLDGEKMLSLVHGKVSHKRFEGIIHTNNESYHIERIEKHFNNTTNDHNVIIYKASDINNDMMSQLTCGVGGAEHKLQELGGYFQNRMQSGNLRKKRLANSDYNTCDIHVWADYEFFTNIGNSDEAQTLDEMALHMLDANDIYRETEFSDGLLGYGVVITSADIIKTNNPTDNVLYGTFTVEELLEAFASFHFDDVCLGHLFTYRDFQGTLGLAYVADPSGSLAGGICDKRTQTFNGELNLNTGLTSLLTFGRKLPQVVSTITTTHEIGHNFGSQHDPSGPCSPGGSEGNYIMYPTATDGNLKNNRLFSDCSKEQIGLTITNNGGCFIPKPFQQECGNGIVEGDEECDCRYDTSEECDQIDSCCLPGECKLKEGPEYQCSPNKYRCCNSSCLFSPNNTVCSTGDECLEPSSCNGNNGSCPLPGRKNNTPCNDNNNICVDGVCSGSVCSNYSAEPCFCSDESQLCHVCCLFDDGICQSTFSRPSVTNATISSGFPCKNFTGYCDQSNNCIFVDTDKVLNNLKDILPSFTSIVNWLKNNWYWVLLGIGITITVIILLQVTYRRKNRNRKSRSNNDNNNNNNAEERHTLTGHNNRTIDATRL